MQRSFVQRANSRQRCRVSWPYSVRVRVCVSSFGEQVQLLHPFQQQFNDESGARVLRLCQFQQKKTRIAQVGSGFALH